MFGAPEQVEPLVGPVADEVRSRLASLGHQGDVVAALTAWASEDNYETRLSPQGIDVKVLAALRESTER